MCVLRIPFFEVSSSLSLISDELAMKTTVYIGTVATHVGNPRHNPELPEFTRRDGSHLESMSMSNAPMFVEHNNHDHQVGVVLRKWVEVTTAARNIWIAFVLIPSPLKKQLETDIDMGAFSSLSIAIEIQNGKKIRHIETSVVAVPRLPNAVIRLKCVTTNSKSLVNNLGSIIQLIRNHIDICTLSHNQFLDFIPSNFPFIVSCSSIRPAWQKYANTSSEVARFSMTEASSKKEADAPTQKANEQNIDEDAEQQQQPGAVVYDEGHEQLRQLFSGMSPSTRKVMEQCFQETDIDAHKQAVEFWANEKFTSFSEYLDRNYKNNPSLMVGVRNALKQDYERMNEVPRRSKKRQYSLMSSTAPPAKPSKRMYLGETPDDIVASLRSALTNLSKQADAEEQEG